MGSQRVKHDLATEQRVISKAGAPQVACSVFLAPTIPPDTRVTLEEAWRWLGGSF